MKVKYIGDKYKVVLLKDKVYDVISVEGDAYRIMTEAENDGIFYIVQSQIFLIRLNIFPYI